MARTIRYVKPCMTNLKGKLGKSVLAEIRSTKTNDEKLKITAQKALDDIMEKVKYYDGITDGK